MPVACSGPALPAGRALRVRVTGVGIRSDEAVTEDPGGTVRNDRGFTTPAGSIDRVMGIDVDQSSVAVGGRSTAGRAEAADADAFVGVPAEDFLEPFAGEPVSVDVEHRQGPSPVREVKPPHALSDEPRSEADIGQGGLPALKCPVRAVRGLASRDEPSERRTVVGAAGIAKHPPDRLAERPPST